MGDVRHESADGCGGLGEVWGCLSESEGYWGERSAVEGGMEGRRGEREGDGQTRLEELWSFAAV